MVKKLSIIFFLFTLSFSSFQAQTPKNSWMLNFGFKYPRLINHSYFRPELVSYGGFVGIQRNFSEHVGLRLAINYDYLPGIFGIPEVKGATHSFDLSADLLYYFVPCEPVSPYLLFGFGPAAYFLDNPPNPFLDSFNFSTKLNSGLGLEWALDEEFKLKTEFVYSTVFNVSFDGSGIVSKGGIFGSDDKSYLSINVGLNYFLDKGENSKYCQLYDGINIDIQPVDYARIEEIVKSYIPREVVKEVVVDRPISSSEKWILVGVNFEFNSIKITASSYPILYDAAKTLLKNPSIDVEIQGYTDNVGSEQYNLKLSQKRAEAVRTYLIAKGINAGRLSAVGYGEKSPVADNSTSYGRAMNRRIEFKIQ